MLAILYKVFSWCNVVIQITLSYVSYVYVVGNLSRPYRSDRLRFRYLNVLELIPLLSLLLIILLQEITGYSNENDNL